MIGLKELKVGHREIGRMKVQGFTPIEIAEKTGYKLPTVRNILSDDLCKAYMNSLSDRADMETLDVRKRLVEMNNKALDRLDDILDPSSEAPFSVIQRTAADVLDRNGYAPKKQVEHVHAHLTADELKEIKANAKAAGAYVIDVSETVETENLLLPAS